MITIESTSFSNMRHTPDPPIDIARAIPELAPLARTTVRLHPRRRKLRSDQSKMGGLFLWPHDETWPVCEEHDSALVGVIQLRAEDVPELGFRQGTDLFQLLWCPNKHRRTQPLYAPAPRVFWRRRADVERRVTRAPRPVLHDELCREYCPLSCALHPERVIEYPDVFELSDELFQRVESSRELSDAIESITSFDFDSPDVLYQYWLSVAEGTKVAGHPQWVQDPMWPQCDCSLRMDYLLTIASAEFDGGSWGRWLAREDRSVWRAGYEVRNAVQRAAGLMLGDMGNLNVFVCRHCPDWPIKSIFQCS